MSENTKNHQGIPFSPISEERIKEILLDTLIELGLVNQPQKRKEMIDE